MKSLSQKLCEFRVTKLRDEGAFKEFYCLEFPRIQRFVQMRINELEVAEDIAHEAFLQIWRYVYVERQAVVHLTALLLTVTRRLVIDHYRRSAKSPEQIDEQIENLSDHGSFLAGIETKENTADLRKALHRLKDEYREVLILRYLDEFEINEIGAVLNKNLGAVRVLIHRALRALRKELGK